MSKFGVIGSDLMVDPEFPGAKPTMSYCGNDAGAKAIAARVIEQFGWEGADMGTVKAAPAIEQLAQLWCIPGFRSNEWENHACRMVTR